MNLKYALYRSLAWIALALACNAAFVVYLHFIQDSPLAVSRGIEFLTSYLIELLLSMDNLFVFFVIFQYFKIPEKQQKRVLYWGIFGAVVMRLVMIVAGLSLIQAFHWVLYILAVFLIWIGFKLLLQKGQSQFSKPRWIAFLEGRFLISGDYQGSDFFVRRNKVLYITPLFLALLCVESSDLLFALDSLPAIFSITQDPFIIYASNILAILGLRSLYFVIVRLNHHFALFKYGIALILIFVGLKMGLSHWVEVPVGMTLILILLVLLGSFLGSYWLHRSP